MKRVHATITERGDRLTLGAGSSPARLEFIARQLERLVNDMAGLKDDMVVVMARLDRLDATTHSLVTEVRAMHSRHERVARRVERLEEANRDAPA
jgi:hypothetical protein